MSTQVIHVSGHKLRRFHDEHLAQIRSAENATDLDRWAAHALGFVEALSVVGLASELVRPLVDEIEVTTLARFLVLKACEQPQAAARTH